MEPGAYGDVGKAAGGGGGSSFYGALSGSVCFPMPLVYNPMSSYPFVSAAPFLPLHHPSLLPPRTHHEPHPADDLGTRALAYLRYQSLGKCFAAAPRGAKGPASPPLPDCGKGGWGTSPEYPASPGAPEEPDSSGKCSVEHKVLPRWSCGGDPGACPICGRTLSPPDLADHFRQEMDSFHDLLRKKVWLGQEEGGADQADLLRLQPYQEVEKRCPEFRKETYLRVRANRMNRLGGLGSRSKQRACFEDGRGAWKRARAALCSPKREAAPDEGAAQRSMLMLELTVQQLSHRAEARTDAVSETFSPENCRNISLFQGPTLPGDEAYHDDLNKSSELADSSCNGFNNLEADRAAGGQPQDKPCSSADLKCLVCMEAYRQPVVSVCCWHVHCESCWLKTLGSKRVCPQCETITAPTDLRRIHL